MKIQRVTITGADDRTKHSDLIEISKKYPFVEWGILFSPTRNITGEPRYPTLDWVKKLMKATKDLNMQFSAHLCGGYTKELLDTGSNDLAIENLESVGDMFKRAQLNFNASKHTVSPQFYNFLKTHTSEIDFIIQANNANHGVCGKIIDMKIPVHFLYDGSGGRGITPTTWKQPIPNHFTGYSGGLAVYNLKDNLDLISKEADFDFLLNNPGHHKDGYKTVPTEIWIDTETGVRTSVSNKAGDDILDIKKVEGFLKIASMYRLDINE